MRVRKGARLAVLVVVSLVGVGCAHSGSAGPSAGAKLPVPPVRFRLFDGATLKGWSGSPDILSVKGGAINGVSEHGGQLILTDGDFADFRLILKSRLLSEKNHLGVCFWGDRRADWGYGECILVIPPTGGMWDYHPGKKGPPREKLPHPDFDPHEWHETEVLADLADGTIRMAVNGVELTRYKDEEPARLRKGPIGLQIHAGASEVEYKDLEIEIAPRRTGSSRSSPRRSPSASICHRFDRVLLSRNVRRDCEDNMNAMIVEPLTVGPIVGYTTDTTCRLWGRGPDAAGARVFGVARAFLAGTPVPVAPRQFKMMAKFDYTGVVDLMGLAPDTAYDYEIGFVRGEATWGTLPEGAPLDWSGASSGTFRTYAPPGTPRPVSFVFGSCRYLLLKWILHWGEESGDKAFRSILEQMARDVRTDFLLMVGDQIYADDFKGIDPDDHLDEFLARYRIAFSQPFIRRLMSRVPTYMILDDHEIKDAWTMNMRPGREALYAAALSAYQSYQVVHGPAFDLSGPGDVEFARTPTRYWYKYDVGPARFFVLDTRNERYVDLAGAEPEIISSIQMSALQQWLAESPPEAPKFVVTSVPMFPDDRSEIADKWAGFPKQRRQLLDEIRSRGVRKVVFLAGDVHCSGWSELRCENDPSFRVYSVISSPFFFPGPRLGQRDRFDFGATIANPPNDFLIGGHGPFLGDDAFTRVSLDAGATVMRVDVYDRKGGLLDGVVLPL